MHGEQDDVSASGGFRRDPKSVLELLVGLELALKPSDSLVLPTCTVQLLQRARTGIVSLCDFNRKDCNFTPCPHHKSLPKPIWFPTRQTTHPPPHPEAMDTKLVHGDTQFTNVRTGPSS